MVRGLPVSIIFHAAIVGISYLGWPFLVSSTRDYDSDAIQIPVELVDIGALNNIAPVRRPEPEPEPEEEIVPEIPEEEPEEEVVPEEEPDPVDESLPEDEVDTASAQEPAEETEPEEVVPDLDAKPDETEKQPEPEPEEPKPAVQKANPLDDFLNDAESTFQSERETRKKREEPKPVRQPLLQDTPPKPQEVRRGAGDRAANTARVDSILFSRIYPCWDGVDDQPHPEKLNVQMHVKLDRSGNILDLRLVSPKRRPLGNSPMGTAVDRALRAVRKCGPYNLPDEDYDLWREGDVNLGKAFTSTKQ